jgi:hypothetical protein
VLLHLELKLHLDVDVILNPGVVILIPGVVILNPGVVILNPGVVKSYI